MPKIIKDVRRQILDCGKEMLFSQEYASITVREIAKKCHIAVGTFYNYFESKEYLVACIQLEDWQSTVAKLRTDVQSADSCMHGFQMVFDAIRAYTDKNRTIWRDASKSDVLPVLSDRHPVLVSQLSEHVSWLLDRYQCPRVPDPATFITEILLQAGCRPNVDFSGISPFIEKLIKP